MSAGLAGSKVIVLLGAGAAGSLLFQNPYFSDLAKEILKVIARHLRESKDGSNGEDGGGSHGAGAGGADSTTAALTAQVRRLTQELRQLSSMHSRPVVITAESSRGSSVFTVVVPAALLGTAVYGYMWWKGMKMSDLMYVTRRGMNLAVDSFNKQMNTLNAAISGTRKQLTGRIDDVSKTLDSSMQVQLAIKKDVTSIHRAVEGVDGEVKVLRNDVQGLEGKIDKIQEISLVAAQGIGLLCQFVSQGGKQQSVEKLNRLSSTIAALTRSLPTAPGSAAGGSLGAGLGGLKDFALDEGPTHLLMNGNGNAHTHPNGLGQGIHSNALLQLVAPPPPSPVSNRGLGGLSEEDGPGAVRDRLGGGVPAVRRSVSSSTIQTPRALSRLDYRYSYSQMGTRSDSLRQAQSPGTPGVTLTEIPPQQCDGTPSADHPAEWCTPEPSARSSTQASSEGWEGDREGNMGRCQSLSNPVSGVKPKTFTSTSSTASATGPAPAPAAGAALESSASVDTASNGSSSFTAEDLSFPPRRTMQQQTGSKSRILPPVNFNL